ncbi:MAG: hypothetical protein Ta2F_02940 [Termitinemataceae bacterium]|nr:MAG: hypothetical protein Ta2F_02940 [Termitinemataceae bacterium]
MTTEELLEYDVIMNFVASFSKSEEAASIIKLQKPLSCKKQIVNLKNDVAQIINLLNQSKSQKAKQEPQGRLPVIGIVLSKLKVTGTTLTAEEAFDVGTFLKNGIDLFKWLNEKNTNSEVNCECVEACKIIFNLIDSTTGQIRDTPSIMVIKQRIATLNKDLQNITASYANDESTKRMLQSSLTTQRDGRSVLAVRANYRSKIKGIVHDVSQGGATVFIEPQEVVEKNNELLIEQHNLDAEIKRLLHELTEQLSVYSIELKSFHNLIIQIECVRARAYHAINTKGVFAKESETQFNLKQARHPLLGSKAVPVDICINDLSLLLITGPNTGGKTVALKTAGLFVLMNQSGLALSVAEDSTLPIFEQVFADIGDEQSISQSLSTFSAHIKI